MKTSEGSEDRQRKNNHRADPEPQVDPLSVDERPRSHAPSTAADSTGSPHLILARNGAILAVSPAWLSAVGHSETDVIGQRFDELLTPSSRRAFREFLIDCYASDEECYCELELQSSIGGTLIGLHKVRIVQAQLHCIVTDLTNLSDASREWQRTFDSTGDAIWIVDSFQHILRANRAAATLLGTGIDDMLGKNCCAILHPTGETVADCPFIKAQKSLKREHAEIYVEGRWLEVTVDPILDSSGTLETAVHIMRDISVRKQAEQAILESERLFRSVFDQTYQLTGILDTQGMMIAINRTALDMVGATEEDVLGKPFWSTPWWTHSDEQVQWLRQAVREAAEGSTVQRIVTHVAVDGKLHTFDFSLKPVVNESGAVEYLIPESRDITQIKEVEEALRESERKFSVITENSADAIFVVDTAGNYVYVNHAASDLLGYSREELLGMSARDVVPQDTRAASEERFAQLLATGSSYSEMTLLRKDGTSIPVDLNAVVLPNGLVYGSCRDLSERKRAAAALEASEEKYRLLFENSFHGIALHEIMLDESGKPMDYRFLEMNGAFGRLIGMERSDLLGKRMTQVFPLSPEEAAHWVHDYGQVALTGKEARFERYSERLGRWLSILAYQPRPGQFATIFEDITTRVEAERALRESEARLLTAGRAAYDLIYEWDTRTDVLKWFGDIDGLLGHAPGTVSRSIDAWIALIHPDDRSKLEDAVAHHRSDTNSIQYEYRIRSQDGSYRTWRDHALPITDETGFPVKWVGVCTDITEQKNAEIALQQRELRLRQTERLRSIGTLAGGVAHEVNNPLMGMINYAELAKDSVPEGSQAREFLDGIISEGGRIAAIVRSLLSFSGKDDVHQSVTDVSWIVDATITLVAASLRHDGISVHVDVPESLPSIVCRTGQVQEVLFHLIANAQSALNERYPASNPDKKLMIAARMHPPDAQTWMRLIVEDRGTGIPAEYRDRIFDPFFTSRTRTEATGLGLSICHTIVTEHGGRLSFESRVGEFTRFFVDLPLA